MANENMSDAEMALEVEQNARKEAGESVYTHVFETPFAWMGRTFETMTFDWGSLTWKDAMACEGATVRAGRTLVSPAYTGEYLTTMAARACTERSEDGKRVIGDDAILAMPMTQAQAICNKARSFLLRAEFRRAQAAKNSGKPS